MGSKAEISLPLALATATVVYTVHGRGLPPTIDLRATESGDEMAETMRKRNTWMAAATVGAISLIAKDPVIFVVGGAMVIALDWMTRADIWASPSANQVEATGMPATAPTQHADQMNYGALAAVP